MRRKEKEIKKPSGDFCLIELNYLFQKFFIISFFTLLAKNGEIYGNLKNINGTEYTRFVFYGYR